MNKKIVLSLFLLLNSCVLVPFIDSAKNMGATESTRRALLQETVKKFYDQVIVGNFTEFGEYLIPEKRDELMSALRKNRRNEKIFEGTIDYVEYLDDSRKAAVDMLVRYYEKPYYVVRERIERQTWEFVGIRTQWKLVDREIIEDNIH